eukprot:CAMPEP_0184496598 /NCGR_PEP_ID=MMETSP0113_2-20130426/34361_1 /TAXON_ID=91329 /ORGANISM="Norrisiella sphaerica, Strain BC52" /LENGTH=497 /DNA_ID=CAMNT_0026883289 /DNA_START=19 /DNA_END=1512 /DNA_ORIENTATION=+
MVKSRKKKEKTGSLTGKNGTLKVNSSLPGKIRGKKPKSFHRNQSQSSYKFNCESSSTPGDLSTWTDSRRLIAARKRRLRRRRSAARAKEKATVEHRKQNAIVDAERAARDWLHPGTDVPKLGIVAESDLRKSDCAIERGLASGKSRLVKELLQRGKLKKNISPSLNTPLQNGIDSDCSTDYVDSTCSTDCDLNHSKSDERSTDHDSDVDTVHQNLNGSIDVITKASLNSSRSPSIRHGIQKPVWKTLSTINTPNFNLRCRKEHERNDRLDTKEKNQQDLIQDEEDFISTDEETFEISSGTEGTEEDTRTVSMDDERNDHFFDRMKARFGKGKKSKRQVDEKLNDGSRQRMKINEISSEATLKHLCHEDWELDLAPRIFQHILSIQSESCRSPTFALQERCDALRRCITRILNELQKKDLHRLSDTAEPYWQKIVETWEEERKKRYLKDPKQELRPVEMILGKNSDNAAIIDRMCKWLIGVELDNDAVEQSIQCPSKA